MGEAHEDEDGLASLAMARANVYGLLAEIYRDAPSAAFLESLRDPSLIGALESLDLSLGEDFKQASLAELKEDLAVEYARLFIGPGPRISPHESLHVDTGNPKDNTFYGPQTAKVKCFIEATGLKYDPKSTGLPDHISAELELMQKLTGEEAKAWAGGDRETAANIQGVEKRFYDEHLSQWIPSFCRKVTGQAKLPFYAEVAKATKDFIEFEGKTLKKISI